jgi:hypothetical protein
MMDGQVVIGPIRGGAILTQQRRKVGDAFRQLEVLSRTQGHSELVAIGRVASHDVAKHQGT